MKNFILLILTVLFVSCVAHHDWDKYATFAGPSPTSPFYIPDYKEVCKLALDGNPDAIKKMLDYTMKLDGEVLVNHGVNLLVIRERHPKIFGEQLHSLNKDNQVFVVQVMTRAEKLCSSLR